MIKNLKILETIPFEGLTLHQLHQECLRRKSKHPNRKFALAVSDETYANIVATKSFFNALELSKSLEDLRSGEVGTMLGVPLLTDAYSDGRSLPSGVSICEIKI